MREKTIQTNYVETTFSELSTELQKAILEAKEATNLSHAPYSNFHVGACLLLEDGSFIQGSNQENASFPLGLCAERTALSAYSILKIKPGIKSILIACRKNEDFVKDPVAPCGLCRQTILEAEHIQNKNIQVILYSEGGKILIFETIKDLLPFYFEFE
jgi:cytidine deaminase